MKKLFLSVLVGFLAVLFTACDEEMISSSGRINPTGKVGDIVVVCSNAIWESPVKPVMDSMLTQFITPYFPDVATFELLQRPEKRFTGGIKQHRNIIFLTVDPSFSQNNGEIKQRNDVWADDQIVIEIVAKDINQLVETCEKGLGKVHKIFDRKSWERIYGRNARKKGRETERRIAEKFGIDIDLPEGSKTVSNKKNFVRIELPPMSRPISFVGTHSEDAGAVFNGIIIYQYRYDDSTQLELKNRLEARDTILKHFVPHENGLYMGTQYTDFLYPEESLEQNYNGTITGTETRGMFRFVGSDKFGTGGAFMDFSFVNPKTKKIICVGGYVDAPPTTSWTHSIREIQAVIKSVEIAQ